MYNQLNNSDLMILEFAYYSFARVGYSTLTLLMQNNFARNSANVGVELMVSVVMFTIMLPIIYWVFVTPMISRLEKENMQLKRFIRLVPVNYLTNSNVFKRYLVKTSMGQMDISKLK